MVIIKESSIESFEHGSLISLSAEGQYISCGVVPYRKTVLNLVLRPHSNEWEQFRLCKGSDSTSFSLQHHGGGYVSPVNGHDGSEWMCRESVSTWEHLRFEVASHDDNNLIHTVLISCVIDGDIRYLNCTPVREGDRVTFKLIVSSVATPWVIKLVAVPSINVLGLQLGNASVWGQVDARSLCVGDRIRGFVLKVLRALLEVGAFYVVGHGLKSDLFQLCQSSLYGNRPYAEDAVSGTDSTFKKNHRLFDTREGFESESMKVLMPLGLARNELQDVIQQYFDDAESLSNGILHAMSAAQIFAQNVDSVVYRGAWRDQYRYLSLRLLSYHPGPQFNSCGKVVHTTAKHTDATWLTLLWNDDIEGLHIKPKQHDIAVMPPSQGALLINTGNVMKKASASFFDAVCHWVLRTAESETRTRVSMPFFYDRSDDTQACNPAFHAGGTRGCH